MKVNDSKFMKIWRFGYFFEVCWFSEGIVEFNLWFKIPGKKFPVMRKVKIWE
jgi:hypothetical protein